MGGAQRSPVQPIRLRRLNRTRVGRIRIPHAAYSRDMGSLKRVSRRSRLRRRRQADLCRPEIESAHDGNGTERQFRRIEMLSFVVAQG